METDYKYKYSKSRLENEINYAIYVVSSNREMERISTIRLFPREGKYLVLEEKSGERFFHGYFSSNKLDPEVRDLTNKICIEDFRIKLDNMMKNASRS